MLKLFDSLKRKDKLFVELGCNTRYILRDCHVILCDLLIKKIGRLSDGKGLVVNLKYHYLNGKSVQITPENERCLSFLMKISIFYVFEWELLFYFIIPRKS